MFGSGRGGGDRVDGGTGKDRLFGDGALNDLSAGGHDAFVFGPGFGNDTVADFHQGEDRLEFDAADVGSFDDLAIDRVAGDTVVTAGHARTVTLEGFIGTLKEDSIFA